MPHDVRTLFLDAETFAKELQGYLEGLGLDDYLADSRTRRAVERCLGLIGEALAQIRKGYGDERLATIPNYQQLIGLRNLLAHEYGVIDDAVLWKTVQENLQTFLASIDAELERIGR